MNFRFRGPFLRCWTPWAVGVLVVAQAVGAAPPVSNRVELRNKLARRLASLPHAETAVGACVIDLASGETVFELRADQPLLPASNAKVFAIAAALHTLGPDFVFETRLATDGVNLLLIGDGDPALGDPRLARARGEVLTEVFVRWADALHRAGHAAFPGDLIVDESVFDEQWTHPAWEPEDLGKWYAAPVGALNFNDNCVDIALLPTTAGQPVEVRVTPPGTIVEIVNQCRTASEGTPILRHKQDSFSYLITGRCSKRWPFAPVSFPDPGRFTADVLLTILRERGIRVAGSVRRAEVRRPDGSVPDSVSILAVERTPLVDVLLRAGKDSQNLFAECLLKRTGHAWARRAGEPIARGTWTTGASAVHAYLAETGLDLAGLVISDGSGLSRENRCTARQLAGLLAHVAGRPEGKLFRGCLSVAGVDGSMRKHLKDSAGVVWAKTGTMRGVRTLSGYVAGPSAPVRAASGSDALSSPTPAQRLPAAGQPAGEVADAEAGADTEADSSDDLASEAFAAEDRAADEATDDDRAADESISTDHAAEQSAAGDPVFAFAILFNGYRGSSHPYRRIQDDFCRVLLDAAADRTAAPSPRAPAR